MMILMRRDAAEEQVQAVLEVVSAFGRRHHRHEPVTNLMISATGEADAELLERLSKLDGVIDVLRFQVELPRSIEEAARALESGGA